jgi:rhodanese-related sulfurtransferase
MHNLPQVSVETLRDLVASAVSEDLQLIDVREPEELAIANLNDLGFRNYPLSQYEHWNTAILRELDPTKTTYVLCHHGMRSAQMSMWLIQKGFTDVHNVSGGIAAWSAAIDPSLPQY